MYDFAKSQEEKQDRLAGEVGKFLRGPRTCKISIRILNPLATPKSFEIIFYNDS